MLEDQFDQTCDIDALGHTHFVKALRWRVFSRDEAASIAASQRRLAAEARARGGIGPECQASKHELLASLCDQHAERLPAAVTTENSDDMPIVPG